MSTVQEPLKYLWIALFANNHKIIQPANDQYSKHVEDAEHNPSAFRDILDYEETSPLTHFQLHKKDFYESYGVDVSRGEFWISNTEGTMPLPFSLESEPLTDRKLIYFREVHLQTVGGVPQEPFVNRYCFGYEGKNKDGIIEKKVLYING